MSRLSCFRGRLIVLGTGKQSTLQQGSDQETLTPPFRGLRPFDIGLNL